MVRSNFSVASVAVCEMRPSVVRLQEMLLFFQSLLFKILSVAMPIVVPGSRKTMSITKYASQNKL
jgi:hypothetical protein